MIFRRSFAAAAVFIVSSVALAQQELPTLEKGIQPAKVFQFHDLDSVNVYNGNLIIAIPVGLSYPLNSGISYNLVLSYNSNIWDLAPAANGTIHASPTKRSNSGLGWIIGMGRYFPHYGAGNSRDRKIV